LFLLIVAGYFGLVFFSRSSQEKLKEIEEIIVQKETPEIMALEKEILKAKEKTEIFAVLLDSHRRTSNFFNFLKENCHKEVFFSKLELDVEGSRATLWGIAKNFQALGEQMLIFREQDLVRSVELTDISLEKEGGVGFKLILLFDTGILK
jgi:Tfp pilus assembly protein PilN